MGRWKRKRHNYRRSPSAASVNSDRSDGSEYNAPSPRAGLSSLDRDRLVKYLIEYREGAKRVCFPDPNVLSDDDTVVTAPASPSPSVRRKLPESSHVTIAGKYFPALTEEVLGRPYLALPKTLSAKQRRAVHGCCVDVDLFHCGVGTDRNSRWIVISIHSDGFEYVDELSPPKEVSFRKCRPWYYRMDHVKDKDEKDTPTRDNITTTSRYVQEVTQKGRESIERLIDQPGRCLRDAQDTIDFQEMEAADLSSVAPMTVGHDDSWMLVDTNEKMKECVQELHDASPSEIGFDLEMYNNSKYFQYTCLLQISSDVGKDYVVDVLEPGVWDTVHLLAPLFADPSICKIGHAIGGMDVKSLHRDFGIFVVNAFDTYEAAKVLRLDRAGLAAVCKHYGLQSSEEYRLLKDTYQNTDWRRRPLTEPMLRYARTDVHYLVELRKLMIRDLTREKLWDKAGMDREEEARMVARALAASLRTIEQHEGDVEEDILSVSDYSNPVSDASDEEGYYTPVETPSVGDSESGGRSKKAVFGSKELRMHAGLMKVISRSQQSCLDLWRGKREPPMKCSDLLSIAKRAATGEVEWTNSHMLLYNELVAWREDTAKEEGVLDDMVCSLELLVTVARKRPTCETELRRISYFLPSLLEECTSYTKQMLAIVQKSREKDRTNASSSEIGTYKSCHVDKSLWAAQNGDQAEKASCNIDISEEPLARQRSLATATGLAFVAAAALVAVLAHRRKR